MISSMWYSRYSTAKTATKMMIFLIPSVVWYEMRRHSLPLGPDSPSRVSKNKASSRIYRVNVHEIMYSEMRWKLTDLWIIWSLIYIYRGAGFHTWRGVEGNAYYTCSVSSRMFTLCAVCTQSTTNWCVSICFILCVSFLIGMSAPELWTEMQLDQYR